MENHRQDQILNRAFLTTAWTFQLVAAGPIFIWLGLAAIFNLFYTFDRVWDFILHLFTSLFAAGIFFIVLVQRKLRKEDASNRALTLRFEVAKLLLAIALWVWLMVDAIFGPDDHYGYGRDGRRTRIIASAVSVFLVFILFVPTVLFVIRDKKLLSRDAQLEEREETDSFTPLLQESRTETA